MLLAVLSVENICTLGRELLSFLFVCEKELKPFAADRLAAAAAMHAPNRRWQFDATVKLLSLAGMLFCCCCCCCCCCYCCLYFHYLLFITYYFLYFFSYCSLLLIHIDPYIYNICIYNIYVYIIYKIYNMYIYAINTLGFLNYIFIYFFVCIYFLFIYLFVFIFIFMYLLILIY